MNRPNNDEFYVQKDINKQWLLSRKEIMDTRKHADHFH